MMLVDSHAHLQWVRFDKDRAAVIRRARKAGVSRIVNIGFDVDESRKGVELAERYEGLYATVGLHPHTASRLDKTAVDELRRLSKHAKVVAIGEIGLDYYRNQSPRKAQQRAFEAQLLLAEELGLPVVVHDREAHDDVFDILSRFVGRVEGVLHCFSGNRAMAQQCIDCGFYVSLAGPVTYPNAGQLQAIARWIDLRTLLLETDSPWLAPQAVRGQRNEPAFLPFTAKKIASLKGISVDELAEATTKNANDLFRLR